jgi:hypothetical protein
MSMRSDFRNGIFALWCCVGLSATATAQVAVGAIGGVVTDSSGGVLPGVTLTLTSTGLIGGNQTTVTDVKGTYEFTRLVPGTYSVSGALQGFQTVVQQNVEVNADRTSRVDLKLSIGAVEETITVAGQIPLLDTTSTLKQTVLSRQALDSVPTGMDIWSITSLAPAVQTQTYDVGGRAMMDQGSALVHGSLVREQGYLVDGMDVTSPQEGAANFFMDTFAAQEVNVQAGQVPAERSKDGVLMNMITKTGTNNLSASAMFEGTNHTFEDDNISGPLRTQLLAGVPAKALAANPNIIPGSALTHMYDSAATIGGPILKDKVWFFGSERYAELNRYQVGSYNADGTQLLQNNTLTNLMGKVSWAAAHNSQLHSLVTWNRKFRPDQNGSTQTQFADYNSTQYNDARVWLGIERWTQVLSSRMVLDVAGAWQTQHNDKGPQPSVPNGTIPKFDSVTNTLRDAAPTYSLPTHGFKQQLNPSLTISAGSHDIKFGYQGTRSVRETFFESLSNFPSGLQEVFANGVPTSVHTYDTPTGSTWFDLNHAVYAQDKWRISNHLTINVGLRFEHMFERINDGTTPLCQQATPFIQAQCFPAISGVPNSNFASPRGSLIYDVFGDGKTALKFAANRYSMSLVGLTDLINPLKLASDTRSWNGAVDASGFPINLGPSSGFNIGTTNHIDPNVKVPYLNEITAGIEQQLFGDVVFYAGYTYRARRNIIGAINLAVPTSSYIPMTVTEASSGQTVTVYNQAPSLRGQFNTLYTNQPVLDDSYQGLDLTVQKRMSRHWMVMGSMSLQKTEGDINMSGVVDGYNEADLNNPNYTYRRGPFLSDVPLSFKVSAVYELPQGFRVAASEKYYQGQPTLTTVVVGSNTVKLTQVSQTVIVAPYGTTRLPNLSDLDVNVSKILKVGRTTLTPRVDIFNLFNQQAATSEVTQLGPSYGNAIQLLGDRLVKFGVNVTF